MRKAVIVAACICLPMLSAVGGFYLHHLVYGKPEAQAAENPIYSVGDHRPEFSLPDLGGASRSISEWNGKIILINFWASWCPPCVREIPAFESVYQSYRDRDVVVVGVAMDDVDNIERFLNDVSVSYPQLHGQLEVSDLMKTLGNKIGALPYTIAIDRGGNIAAVAPQGELDYQQIEGLITPLL